MKHGKGVSVQTRQDKEHDYVFIMNFTEERQTITLPSKGTDLLSGDELEGELILNQYEVRVIKAPRNS